MKFLMLMIPRGYQPAVPAAERFSPEAMASMEAMGKFNDDLAKAGKIIDVDGLEPPERTVRVAFTKGEVITTDGPYAEAREVIGGYWLIELNSKQEAVEWARRCPAQEGDVIEIRQVYEMATFQDDMQKAAEAR